MPDRSEQSVFDVRRDTLCISRGEEAAFNRFFSAFSDRIYRYMMVLGKGNERLAKDAHQEALIRCARYMKPIPTETDLWRWLTRVMRSAFIDVVRLQEKTSQFKDLLPEEFLSDQQEEKEQQYLMDRLKSGMSKLEDEGRKLLEAYYFEGIPQKTLALQNNLSARAVGMRISRMRQMLRDHILKGGKDD